MDTSRKWFVYLIWSVINDKRYVGKTYDCSKRWKKHLASAKSNARTLLARNLYRSKKTNITEFTITQIGEFQTEQEAFEAEMFWIAKFECNRCRFQNGSGLNLTDGGEGISGNRRIFSESHLKNLRNNVHNRRMVPDVVARIKDDFQSGLARSNLATKYGFSYKNICRALKK